MAIHPRVVPDHVHAGENDAGDATGATIPTSHATSHAAAGTDPITPASIGAADTDHSADHETGGADALAHLAATVIDSGTLDGDRLPAMSTGKAGAVPATGTPSGLFLRDDGFGPLVTFNSAAPATPHPWQLWYDNGIGSSAVKVQLSLREHKAQPSYTPGVTFSKPDGATVKAASTASGQAMYYLFVSLPKAAVNGRKVKVTWQGNSSTTSASQFVAKIIDGSYSRSSGTDFPNGAYLLGKGAGVLATIGTQSTTFASRTDVVTADLSSGTETHVTIMVQVSDAWSSQSNWVQVTAIEITDLDDNVLIEADIAGALSMESSGGVADYGVVGSGTYSAPLKTLEYWDEGSNSWLHVAEPYIEAGLTTQFLRGDKTFQLLNAGAVQFAATDKLMGRATAGAGAGEEITCTAAGRALLDDATAADQAHTLGLGTADSPQFQGLTVLGSSGVGKFVVLNTSGTPCVYRAGTDLTNNTPLFVYRRARGTLDTPLSVLADYGLGTFEMGAYDGNAWTSGWDGGVGFMGVATEDWSSTAHGAMFQFLTTPNGSTNWVVRMTIRDNGNILIGTTTDIASAILNVASTSKGALLPRMTTTQRDAISTPVEGMLIYNTTTHALNHYNGSAWAAV